MPKIEKQCDHCGEIFTTTTYAIHNGRGKNCSRKCQYESIKRQVILICQTCKNTFSLQQSDVAYRTRIGEPPKYCSRKCAHASEEWSKHLSASLKSSDKFKESKKHSTQKMTETVRQPQHRQGMRENSKRQWADPATKKKLLEGIKKRSQSIEWKSAKHFQKGADHPKYKGEGKRQRAVAQSQYPYKQWRMLVFKKHNHTCQICFERGGSLQAHHVKSWADFPELRYEIDNGMTLCIKCHKQAHRVCLQVSK